jgi:hypothetical protein
MIALLGGIYGGKYAEIDDVHPGQVLRITGGAREQKYIVRPGGVAEVIKGGSRATIHLAEQYVCPQHTRPRPL